jgi:MFS family permease
MPGFFVARFFLGVAESGLFPGVVYYFSMWYKRRERQYRVSLFFSAASLAGAFGGILAYVSDELPPWSNSGRLELTLARESAGCVASYGLMGGAGFSSW